MQGRGVQVLTLHLPTGLAGSLRGHLRASTADLHADVDALFAPLMAHGTAGYQAFLLRSAAALLPLERVLQAANIERVCPDWLVRSRSSALKSDLMDLCLAEPALVPIPDMHGPAFQLGILYVLEGSRLGAHVLLKDALRTLPPQAHSATRYLAHGRGQPLWPTFLQRLEASASARDALTDTVAGARTAFSVFIASAKIEVPISPEGATYA